MVVAVLANRFAPSSRGLQRASRSSSINHHSISVRQQQQQQLSVSARSAWSSRSGGAASPASITSRTDGDEEQQQQASYYQRYHPDDNSDDDDNNNDGIAVADQIVQQQQQQEQQAQQRQSTTHRRKPFRAMACLTSFAADMDVISDWFFYHDTIQNDRQYRSEWQDGDGAKPYLIPPILLHILLASCVAGTILWVILASDGRIAAPLLRRLGVDKLSMGAILLLCVLLEDIPQVVLTFLVEDYYEEFGYLSGFAMWNVMASFYDTIIKLVEAYDERHDVVETGVWCKHSVAQAHADVITAVLTLDATSVAPIAVPEQIGVRSKSAPAAAERSKSPTFREVAVAVREAQQQHKARSSTRSLPLLLGPEILLPRPTPIPPLLFLTAALDGGIKLWSSFQNGPSRQNSRSGGDAFTCGASSADVATALTKCVRQFQGHKAGVTCLAFLGAVADSQTTSYYVESGRSSRPAARAKQAFLSGCQSGQTKLWDVDTGVCLRDFECSPENTAVSSIAVVQMGIRFVVGYQDGSARLWDVASGSCVGLYNGHLGNVGAICSLNDGVSFVTGSDDKTLRLWNTSWAVHQFKHTLSKAGAEQVKGSEDSTETFYDALSVPPSHSMTTPVPSDEKAAYFKYGVQPIHEERSSVKIFSGHTRAVVSVTCMESQTFFVSGSQDGTARLWSAVDGSCLQVFTGHRASVSAVTAVDEVTLLTGSGACGRELTSNSRNHGFGLPLFAVLGHRSALLHCTSLTFYASAFPASSSRYQCQSLGRRKRQMPTNIHRTHSRSDWSFRDN